MKKTLVLLLALVLAAALCYVGFFAPAKLASPPGAYRVLVLDADGSPVEGVTMQFCSADVCLLGTTDAAGAAVFDMPGGEVYTVHILQVPEGYEKNTREYETQDSPGDLTVMIDKEA